MATPNLTIARTPVEEAFVEAFRTQSEAGEAKGWARDLRGEAARIFTDLGLPHRRVETWKWTDLRRTMQDVLPVAAPGDAAPKLLGGYSCDRAVFVNGRYAPTRSKLPEDVEIVMTADVLNGERTDLSERIGALTEIGEASPTALNAAFMTDGIVLRLREGAKLERPLHLAHVFTGDPGAVYARNLIVLEAGAEAEIIETFEHDGPGGYVVNAVTEAHVGDGATLRHRTYQDDAPDAVHLNALLASIGAKSKLEHFVLTAGAKLSRHQIGVRMAGEYAELELAGVSMLEDKRHADVSLVVHHDAPHGISRETFATVLEDRARGVFQGKIVVPPKSQKTDGRMMSRALFLSDAAEFDAKPELEIYADDVLCGHGATSGRIDDDHLFYLMARGIPRAEAESLLVAGFIAEAMEAIEDETLREHFSRSAEAWLAKRAA